MLEGNVLLAAGIPLALKLACQFLECLTYFEPVHGSILLTESLGFLTLDHEVQDLILEAEFSS